jgi:DNA-directed RNA polymerase specialized sigma24 family protein
MLSEKIAQLIQSADRGDAGASEELFTILYGELHRLARRQLGRGGLTISPTTLLHETYLNLSGRPNEQFPDRARFLAYASRTMRSLLVTMYAAVAPRNAGGGPSKSPRSQARFPRLVRMMRQSSRESARP